MSAAKRLSEERLQEFKDHADSSGGYILEKEIYRHIAWQEIEIARLEQHVKRLEGWKEIDRKELPANYEIMSHSRAFMLDLVEMLKDELKRLEAELKTWHSRAEISAPIRSALKELSEVIE